MHARPIGGTAARCAGNLQLHRVDHDLRTCGGELTSNPNDDFIKILMVAPALFVMAGVEACVPTEAPASSVQVSTGCSSSALMRFIVQRVRKQPLHRVASRLRVAWMSVGFRAT